MFHRIGLHRPYFLRRLDTDTFEKSRQACIASAKHDSEIRRSFYNSTSAETRGVSGGVFRAFQSTMICGIALIIDPDREDAAEMHQILDEFLNPTQETYNEDIDVAKELKIIRFLQSKIVGKDPCIPRSGMENHENPVFSNSEPNASVSFSQTESRQPVLPVNLLGGHGPMERPPFVPAFSNPDTPESFRPAVPNTATQMPPYVNEFVGQDPTMDNWSYVYPSDNNSISGNEQWVGGSDIVPQIIVPILNGDNAAPTNGEWSYWEALINQIRLGGPSTS